MPLDGKLLGNELGETEYALALVANRLTCKGEGDK